MIIAPGSLKDIKLNLPKQRGAFYGGRWHQPKNNRVTEQRNPGTGASLGHVADCGGDDIDAARGALGDKVDEVYRFYTVPASNTAVGHIILENRPSSGPAGRGLHAKAVNAIGAS
jgi:hypothetical protein